MNIGSRNKKWKNTPSTAVHAIFINQRANVKTFAAAHKLPSKNILAKKSIAVKNAYASSSVLSGLLYLIDIIFEIIKRTAAMPENTSKMSTGIVTTSNVLLSQVLVEVFSV
jgi:hypothetical protein